MKKSTPKKRFLIKDISATEHVIIHNNSLCQIKGGGGVVVEDIMM